jgi:hypothetical protein
MLSANCFCPVKGHLQLIQPIENKNNLNQHASKIGIVPALAVSIKIRTSIFYLPERTFNPSRYFYVQNEANYILLPDFYKIYATF